LGSRLHGDLQRRPPADARRAAQRAGAAMDAGPVRGGGPAVSGHHRLARERDPRAARAAARPSHLLQRAAVHAQRDPRAHGRRGLFAQRAPVRGGRVWRADHQRHVGRAGDAVRARRGDSHREAGRRRVACAPRHPGARAARHRGAGTGTSARRAHRGAPRGGAGGIRAGAARRGRGAATNGGRRAE
jgi:hypothetical protein